MRDLVFLFGAGASYGAGGTLPEQPPLGFQLYPALARSYPRSWGALPLEVRDAFVRDFEQGMQLVYDHLGHAIPALMREMAVYLIQFRPFQGRTLYDQLVSDLHRRGALTNVLFSTLNYDCILEFCIAEQGYGISYFDEGNAERVPVWKLHGSCNMFSHNVQASPGVFYSTGVTWEGGIEAFLDANAVIQRCLVETALSPVMCLYMRGKLLNVSPSAIRQLQQAWQEKVGAATAVFCVGVRPLPEDDHIWLPLARSKSTLCFVGDDAALDRWAKEHGRTNVEFLGRKFNEAYPAIVKGIEQYGAHRS